MTTPTKTAPTTPKPSFLKRALLSVLRTGVTLTVIAGAAAAVHVGSGFLAQRAEAVPAPDAAPATPVLTTPIVYAPGYMVERSFIGQVEAQRTVDMSFELAGKLTSVLVDEGDPVMAGEVLARLDTGLLTAERDRLLASRQAFEAQLRFAEQTVARNAQLSERGFASQARLDEALARQDEMRARIAELDAGLKDVALRLAKSEITAPFDGRVTQRQVDGGETLSPGVPVLELVETGAPQVRVGIPLDLQPAALEQVRFLIGGAERLAALVTLRPDVDPLTRTRTAVFALSDEAGSTSVAAFGQTARLVTQDMVAANGLWIETTALKEGLRGQWTVLVVDADDIVRTASVEVLHTEPDRVFARGVFPEGTALVDAGPQRVTPGQRVTRTTGE
ncbi:MAG: efflux RND transporter periplasmic adaptor subunit [Pseudomonadota bacterium]